MQIKYNTLYHYAGCLAILLAFTAFTPIPSIVSYIADPRTQHLQMCWKNNNQPYRSIANLKTAFEKQKKKLVFAMNGGMYKTDNSPLGLYIENGIQQNRLNIGRGEGNFYLQPNGVFYLTGNNVPVVCTTSSFKENKGVLYATQSGPMLVINDTINPLFKQGSSNLNIRNGVGILPGNKVLFAISAVPVNFYDFACFFKNAGCSNALYLDGYVSRAYIPEKGRYDEDGDFGVLIAVTQP